MTELDKLREENQELKRRMGIGENDPAKDGYLVLVKMLRQQTAYLDKFDIASKISNLAKEDAVYPRAMDMIENLPKMITSVSNLRIELKMDGEEKKSQYKPISAKEIANGNV